MRILQVTPGYSPQMGGVERHVQDVSEAFSRMGHDVAVAAMSSDARLPRRELVAGVEVRRFAGIGAGSYRFPLGLARFMRRHSFDVVHAHNYHALPLLLAALSGGPRCVVSPCYHGHGHNRAADLVHHLYRPLGQAGLRRAGAIVCLSHAEADLVASRLAIARECIHVVPSILALPEGAYEPSTGPDQDMRRVILSVARLEPYKRVDRAIAALRYMPQDYRLAIVGEGAERVKLERLTALLGLAERVDFLSRVSDAELRRQYCRARVVITMSEGESFSRMVVEALSHGCQVICSDIPAFRDLASTYPACVRMVAPGASDREVAAILQARADQPRAPQDLQHYSWRSVAAELLRIYTRLAVHTEGDQPTMPTRAKPRSIRLRKDSVQ